ncbi:MAG: alpha/beta hydrolase [Clostridiales bacterium]|nr:alpha/beta hydrolase [Clostridiales bacterium]
MGSIRVIPNNPGFKGLAEMVGDIEFACPDGHPLKLHMLKPWKRPERQRLPLVVFVQGSSWTKPNQYWEIPQLSRLARRGFVVATVTHRSCFEAKAPAFLQDVKSAIRFLKANADEYGVDPERVCIWGTSSGGNAALLVGMTADDPAFENDVCPGVSTKVQAVVDCFGPTDLMRMVEVQYAGVPATDDSIFVRLGGAKTADGMRDTLTQVSPICYAEPGRDFPPMLLLHGDNDPVVLYSDTERFYKRMEDLGYDVDLVRVMGAEHEGSFWSEAILEIIFDFIEEKIG